LAAVSGANMNNKLKNALISSVVLGAVLSAGSWYIFPDVPANYNNQLCADKSTAMLVSEKRGFPVRYEERRSYECSPVQDSSLNIPAFLTNTLIWSLLIAVTTIGIDKIRKKHA
jgi:hypothetical protein